MRWILLCTFFFLTAALPAGNIIRHAAAAIEPATEQTGRVRTFMKGRIERWEVTLNDTDGTIEAYMKDDPNRWTFSIGSLEGEINSMRSDQFHAWEISIGKNIYTLRTHLSGTWDKWDLTGPGITGVTTMETLYKGSWDKWELENDSLHCDITTYMNNSWDDWEIKGELAKMTPGEKAAAVFMPIFVSRIYRPKIAR